MSLSLLCEPQHLLLGHVGAILLPPHRLVRRLFPSGPVRGLLLYLSALVYFVVEVVQQLSKKASGSILALDQRKET